MKRIFLLLLLIVFLESCSSKSVQLPETLNSDITEIKDVSAAYLFYDETQKDSISLNRKNLISTTNWLINVDKRLTLKQAIPSIMFLQNKKRKTEMHKNKDAKNYFTCSNPEIQNLAFIEFTDVVYHTETSWEYYSKTSDKTSNARIIIDYRSSENIEIRLSSEIELITINKAALLTKIKNLIANQESTIEILLNFNQNLTFQDYITNKSLLLKLDLKNVIFIQDEFIYN